MALQTDGICITAEGASQLSAGTPVAFATTGLIAACGADARCDGVVVANSGSTSPYLHTVQLTGVAQVQSDGSGTIAIGDSIVAGATSQCKKRALADGTTTRYFIGVSLSTVAATAGLLVDVLLRPYAASNS